MAYCTTCGSALADGAAFCAGCGASAPPPAPKVAPGRRRRWSVGTAAAMVGSLAVVAAAAAWLVVSPSSPLHPDGSVTTAGAGDGSVPDGAGTDPIALDFLGAGAPPPAVSVSIDLGDPVEIASGVVGPEGGVITAPDGLVVDVPAGAHPGPTAYTISVEEILGHDLGPGLDPVSAMYSVDNGDGYAAEAVWVEVPAEVPEGGFAMGFLYDPATGGLEALPLVGVGEDSVVVATSHFSRFFVHGVDAPTFAALVSAQVASETQSALGAMMLADTGFRPGVDDWPFTNFGSVVAPGGHCAGQSLSAMWYFLERTRRGGQDLTTVADNDGMGRTALWQDDRNGYRLASVVQQDYGDGVLAWAEQFQRYLDRWRLTVAANAAAADAVDLWQYAAFLIAMQVTGEPQYVSIGRLDSGGVRRGHAMIVYGADTRGLWIADPNYPGRFRRIPWDAAGVTLGPYFSGDDATALGRRYDAVTLMAKTSLIDWAGLGVRFVQMDLGVAGDDRFPGYGFEALETLPDGTHRWVAMEDGYTTISDRIEIRLDGKPGGGSWRISLCGGTGAGACVAPAGHDTGVVVPLSEGDNHVDLYLEGYSSSSTWEYLDFARLTIHRGMAIDVTVIPATQEVEAGTGASFTIEVANLGAADLKDVEVRVDPGGLCASTIPSIGGPGVETVGCSLTLPEAPGRYQYEVTAAGTRADGRRVTRSVFTEITVGEAGPPVGDIIGALNRLHEAEFGSPGDAAEVPLDAAAVWSNWLAAEPTPVAVYRITPWAPVFVGVYATPDDAEAALQAAADRASARVLDATGEGVHWCDWRRVTLQSTQFHSGDSFVLTTTSKTVDTDPSEPIGQPDAGWCAYPESQVPNLGGPGTAEVVETSYQEIGWVQGRLLVTMTPVWGPDTAERLYAELLMVTAD